MESKVRFYPHINPTLNVFSQLATLHARHRNPDPDPEEDFFCAALHPELARVFNSLRKKAEVTRRKALLQLRTMMEQKSQAELAELAKPFSLFYWDLLKDSESRQIVQDAGSIIELLFIKSKKSVVDEIAKFLPPLLLANSKALKVIFSSPQKQYRCLLNQRVFASMIDFMEVVFLDQTIAKIQPKKRRDGKQLETDHKIVTDDKKLVFAEKALRALTRLFSFLSSAPQVKSSISKQVEKATVSLAKLLRVQSVHDVLSKHFKLKSLYCQLLAELLQFLDNYSCELKSNTARDYILKALDDEDSYVQGSLFRKCLAQIVDGLNAKQVNLLQTKTINSISKFALGAQNDMFKALPSLLKKYPMMTGPEKQGQKQFQKVVRLLQKFVDQDEYRLSGSHFIQCYFTLLNTGIQQFKQPKAQQQLISAPIKLLMGKFQTLKKGNNMQIYKGQLFDHLEKHPKCKVPSKLQGKALLTFIGVIGVKYAEQVDAIAENLFNKKDQAALVSCLSSISFMTDKLQNLADQFQYKTKWAKARAFNCICKFKDRPLTWQLWDQQFSFFVFAPYALSQNCQVQSDFSALKAKYQHFKIDYYLSQLRKQNTFATKIGSTQFVRQNNCIPKLFQIYVQLLQKPGFSQSREAVLIHIFKQLSQAGGESLHPVYFKIHFLLYKLRLFQKSKSLLSMVKQPKFQLIAQSFVRQSSALISSSLKFQIKEEKGLKKCADVMQFLDECAVSAGPGVWMKLLQQLINSSSLEGAVFRGQPWFYLLKLALKAGLKDSAQLIKKNPSATILCLSASFMISFLNLRSLKEDMAKLCSALRVLVIDEIELRNYQFYAKFVSQVIGDSSFRFVKSCGLVSLTRQILVEVAESDVCEELAKIGLFKFTQLLKQGKDQLSLATRSLLKAFLKFGRLYPVASLIYLDIKKQVFQADFTSYKDFRNLSLLSAMWAEGQQFQICQSQQMLGLVNKVCQISDYIHAQCPLYLSDFFNYIIERTGLNLVAHQISKLQNLILRGFQCQGAMDCWLIPRACQLLRKTMPVWQGFSEGFQIKCLSSFQTCLRSKLSEYSKIDATDDSQSLEQFRNQNSLELITQCSQTITRLAFSGKQINQTTLYQLLKSPYLPLQKAAFYYLRLHYSRRINFNGGNLLLPFFEKGERPMGNLLSWISLTDRIQKQQVALLSELQNKVNSGRQDKQTQTLFDLAFTNEKRQNQMLEGILQLLMGQQVADSQIDDSIEPEDLKLEDDPGQDLPLNHYRLGLIGLVKLCKAFPRCVKEWSQCSSAKKYRLFLIKVLKKLVSSALFQEESMRLAQQHESWRREDFMIFCDSSRKQITAQYAKQGQKLAVVLRMEKDYPCSFISVHPTGTVKLQSNKGRILRMQVILRQRNGSILAALNHWKFTVDKQLQGHEVCAICYDIVNPFTRELPRKPCKTCSKKFHAGCIVKWLQSKNKNECPLCKSQFS